MTDSSFKENSRRQIKATCGGECASEEDRNPEQSPLKGREEEGGFAGVGCRAGERSLGPQSQSCLVGKGTEKLTSEYSVSTEYW